MPVSEDEFDELKQKLIINKTALDEELVHQAHSFYELADMYSAAVSQRDALYEEVKQVDADLYGVIRVELEQRGVKATEAIVASQVQSSQEHKDAHKAFLDAKLLADKLGALKEAYGQRAYMLRDLVQLYAVGYFSDTPIRSTNASDAMYDHRRMRMAEKRTAKGK